MSKACQGCGQKVPHLVDGICVNCWQIFAQKKQSYHNQKDYQQRQQGHRQAIESVASQGEVTTPLLASPSTAPAPVGTAAPASSSAPSAPSAASPVQAVIPSAQAAMYRGRRSSRRPQTQQVTVSAAPTKPGPIPPPAPTNLTATSHPTSISLSWTAAVGAVTYNIYRGTSSGAETLLATLVSGTAYTDATGLTGIAYYYKVAGVNTTGIGAKSNEASAALPPGFLFVTQTDAYNGLVFGKSQDGIAFSGLFGGASQYSDSTYGIRDPYPIYWNGKWYVCYSPAGPIFGKTGSRKVFIISSPDLSTWSAVATIQVASDAVGTDLYVDVPHFLVDSAGLHLLCQLDNDPATGYQDIQEFHPTSPDLSTWSSATPVTSSNITWALSGALVPVMTSNTAPSGVCSASSILNNDPTYAAWHAFDASTTSLWHSYNESSWWLQYQFASPVTAVGMHLAARTEYNLPDSPVVFGIWGSNDGITWTVLQTYNIGMALAAQSSTIDLGITNNSAWTYYRMNVTKNVLGDAFCNLEQWQLYSVATPTITGQTIIKTTGNAIPFVLDDGTYVMLESDGPGGPIYRRTSTSLTSGWSTQTVPTGITNHVDMEPSFRLANGNLMIHLDSYNIGDNMKYNTSPDNGNSWGTEGALVFSGLTAPGEGQTNRYVGVNI